MRLYFAGQALVNANAAAVTADTTTIRASSGRPLRLRTRIHVKGFLEGNGQSDLTNKENTLRKQLQGAYGDLVLKQDSGSYSSLALVNNNSISGVVIEDGPTFTEAVNAEFVSYRTFEFTGTAEFLIPNTANAILSWKETLVFTGDCGPEFSWRKSLNTPPVLQQTYPFSTMTLHQSGRAVGHLAYPKLPAPFFPPPIYRGKMREVIEEAPTRIGPASQKSQGLVDFPVSWKYFYESNVPLIALPNTPGF